MRTNKYAYCIFYLEKKLWKNIPKQLIKAGYPNVKAIIPTVNILRCIRGKMIMEEHPILFNYGFIRMPLEKAYSRTFLNKLKRKIPGIHSWLRDTETIHPRKKKRRIDNTEDWDDFSKVATCSREEVKRFLRLSKENKKYSLDDLVNLKPGDYVHLKGYPYEGTGATVLEVNYKSRTVEVEILVLHGRMKLKLPFDNVLYSVYLNYDPNTIHASFLDKDPENVTEESINRLIDYKTY